jgi:hypothetical protein
MAYAISFFAPIPEIVLVVSLIVFIVWYSWVFLGLKGKDLFTISNLLNKALLPAILLTIITYFLAFGSSLVLKGLIGNLEEVKLLFSTTSALYVVLHFVFIWLLVFLIGNKRDAKQLLIWIGASLVVVLGFAFGLFGFINIFRSNVSYYLPSLLLTAVFYMAVGLGLLAFFLGLMYFPKIKNTFHKKLLFTAGLTFIGSFVISILLFFFIFPSVSLNVISTDYEIGVFYAVDQNYQAPLTLDKVSYNAVYDINFQLLNNIVLQSPKDAVVSNNGSMTSTSCDYFSSYDRNLNKFPIPTDSNYCYLQKTPYSSAILSIVTTNGHSQQFSDLNAPLDFVATTNQEKIDENTFVLTLSYKDGLHPNMMGSTLIHWIVGSDTRKCRFISCLAKDSIFSDENCMGGMVAGNVIYYSDNSLNNLPREGTLTATFYCGN